jgi:hypothetical protein
MLLILETAGDTLNQLTIDVGKAGEARKEDPFLEDG